MEEEKLQQLITCKVCNKKYDDPILLPCFKSVCSKHVYIETTGDQYLCPLCNQTHLIPNGGFITNNELSHLIRMSNSYVPVESALGENNKKAKQLRDELEKILNQTETIVNDPSHYIHEYFSNLKSDIDLNREKCLKMINDIYYKIIKDIEEAERKCKDNIKNFCLELDLLKVSNKESKLKQENVEGIANKPCLNSPIKWNDYKNDVEKIISKTTYILKKFQNQLLLNRSFLFKKKLIINENNFGDLSILEDQFPDENRLKGKIEFPINEFRSFRYDKFYRWNRGWFIVDNKLWRIRTRMKEKEDHELKLEVFIEPDASVLDIKENPIKTKCTVSLLRNDGSIYKSSTFEKTYDDYKSNGYSSFATYKEIRNEANNVYNKETDSIKLQIEISVLK